MDQAIRVWGLPYDPIGRSGTYQAGDPDRPPGRHGKILQVMAFEF
jgi:hypothetical protein